MVTIWLVVAGLGTVFEANGNPKLDALGVNQSQTSTQPGGNYEGKEIRDGISGSTIFAGATTGTSTGAVNSMHDSYTPLGGMMPLVQMKFGEVSPGGIGVGLNGILVLALLSVFIAGLMVGRTPEYLGKKIQATEVKLVVLYTIAMPFAVLVGAGIAIVTPSVLNITIWNPGPHGFTEILYAFTSAGNNNGSAFAGITANTQFMNTALGHRDADRSLRAHHPDPGDRGFARPQGEGPRIGRHLPDEHTPLRRAAVRRHRHRRRAHVLPGTRARAHRRAARNLGDLCDDHSDPSDSFRGARRDQG